MNRLLTRLALLSALALASAPLQAQSRKLEFAASLPDHVGRKTVVVDTVAGTGDEATPDRYVVMDYEGWVYDPGAPLRRGVKFDSTRDRGYPLSVLLGRNRMIPGLDLGIAGMRVGGRRTLVIPPEMGYGDRLAFGVVPPKSVLLFEIELLDVVGERSGP